MCDDNMHPQRLTRTFTSTSHEHSGMDDTARKVLGTTSMPHNKTKCMRAILAENVSEPPTNVGKLPRGLEIGGSRGGPPALHRTPRACEGGKGGERWSEESCCCEG